MPSDAKQFVGKMSAKLKGIPFASLSAIDHTEKAIVKNEWLGR